MSIATSYNRLLSTARSRPGNPVLLISAASLLLSLLYCPPVDLFYDDIEIFRYFGRLIASGATPYRDVFDHKPPLIYFFNVAGPWGIWAINTVLVLLASLLFLRLGRRTALARPWLPPLLFNLLIRNYIICFGVNMTRGYTAIFLLLFFCLLLDDSRRQRYFWLGLLTAATFFMQQDGIIVLAPLLLYAGLTVPSPRDFWLAAAGFLALTLPLLAYFAGHHALGPFWQDGFQFNFHWYLAKPGAARHFQAVRQGLANSDLEMPLIIALTLGCAALLGRHKKKRLLLAAIATLLLSFSAEALSGMLQYGNPFYYYLLPLSSTLPILVFVAWAYTQENWLQDRKNQLVFGFLLCCLPLYDSVQHATHLSTNNGYFIMDQPEYHWLRAHRPGNRQFYAWGDNNWVRAYNEFGIYSPCRWIYQHFWEWYPQWDSDHQELKKIEADLLRFQTHYIMYDPAVNRFKDPTARAEWESFLAKYYQLLSFPGSPQPHLWIRRSA